MAVIQTDSYSSIQKTEQMYRQRKVVSIDDDSYSNFYAKRALFEKWQHYELFENNTPHYPCYPPPVRARMWCLLSTPGQDCFFFFNWNNELIKTKGQLSLFAGNNIILNLRMTDACRQEEVLPWWQLSTPADRKLSGLTPARHPW